MMISPERPPVSPYPYVPERPPISPQPTGRIITEPQPPISPIGVLPNPGRVDEDGRDVLVTTLKTTNPGESVGTATPAAPTYGTFSGDLFSTPVGVAQTTSGFSLSALTPYIIPIAGLSIAAFFLLRKKG